MIWDNFSIFRTNCAIACGTRAYIAARIFADVAQGKWCPKFPKSFMLLAHNLTPLWLLEFCLSIFGARCSSLSEDTAEFRYVPLYIADQVEFRFSFYKNFTLFQSKFHISESEIRISNPSPFKAIGVSYKSAPPSSILLHYSHPTGVSVL